MGSLDSYTLRERERKREREREGEREGERELHVGYCLQ